jgi:hypothetical protein
VKNVPLGSDISRLEAVEWSSPPRPHLETHVARMSCILCSEFGYVDIGAVIRRCALTAMGALAG